MSKALRFSLLLPLICLQLSATDIRVVSKSGTPMKNVLVIVRSLDTGHELGRFLTAENGKTPSVDFDQGLYRVVATCPYGTCETAIKELFAGEAGDTLTVTTPARAIPHTPLPASARKEALTIVDPQNRPLRDVQVLVRSVDGVRGDWYITRANGGTPISLVDDPSVLLVLYQRRVQTYVLLSNCIGVSPETYGARYCKEDHGSGIVLSTQ